LGELNNFLTKTNAQHPQDNSAEFTLDKLSKQVSSWCQKWSTIRQDKAIIFPVFISIRTESHVFSNFVFYLNWKNNLFDFEWNLL
jgi:hypothetical protein